MTEKNIDIYQLYEEIDSLKSEQLDEGLGDTIKAGVAGVKSFLGSQGFKAGQADYYNKQASQQANIDFYKLLNAKDTNSQVLILSGIVQDLTTNKKDKVKNISDQLLLKNLSDLSGQGKDQANVASIDINKVINAINGPSKVQGMGTIANELKKRMAIDQDAIMAIKNTFSAETQAEATTSAAPEAKAAETPVAAEQEAAKTTAPQETVQPTVEKTSQPEVKPEAQPEKAEPKVDEKAVVNALKAGDAGKATEEKKEQDDKCTEEELGLLHKFQDEQKLDISDDQFNAIKKILSEK
jgi:hypothetical protein